MREKEKETQEIFFLRPNLEIFSNRPLWLPTDLSIRLLFRGSPSSRGSIYSAFQTPQNLRRLDHKRRRLQGSRQKESYLAIQYLIFNILKTPRRWQWIQTSFFNRKSRFYGLKMSGNEKKGKDYLYRKVKIEFSNSTRSQMSRLMNPRRGIRHSVVDYVTNLSGKSLIRLPKEHDSKPWRSTIKVRLKYCTKTWCFKLIIV